MAPGESGSDGLADGLSLQVRSTGLSGWIIGLIDAWGFGSVDPQSKGPRVILVNKFGKEHILKQYLSVRKAREDLPRIRGEIAEQGYFSWAEQVGVPPHFDIMPSE